MDPTASWNAMLESLKEGDREAARENAEALCAWFGFGGSAPVVSGGLRRVDFEWIARAVEQTCGGRTPQS